MESKTPNKNIRKILLILAYCHTNYFRIEWFLHALKQIMYLFNIVFIAIIISDCGTFFSGTRQALHIQAIDMKNNDILEQARCTVMHGAGGGYCINSPGVVTVARSSGPISVFV